jgi:hypothetical protein
MKLAWRKHDNIGEAREAREAYRDKVIIYYPFHVGGHPKDRGLWCAEINMEVLDYAIREYLMKQYPAFVLFTRHKDGTVSAGESLESFIGKGEKE